MVGFTAATLLGGIYMVNAVQDAKIASNTDRIEKLEKQSVEISKEVIRLVDKLESNVTNQLNKLDGKIDRIIERQTRSDK